MRSWSRAPPGRMIYTLQGMDAETNRFRGEMLAQVSDAVIAVDGEERIIYLNAAAERLYGVTASGVLGRDLSEIYESRWLQPGEARPRRRPPCASAANGAAKTFTSDTMVVS